MLLNPPRQRNLLTDLRTRRLRQLDLREISLDRKHSAARRGRPDVDEQDLALDEFGDLGGLFVLRLYTEETAEEEEADLEFCISISVSRSIDVRGREEKGTNRNRSEATAQLRPELAQPAYPHGTASGQPASPHRSTHPAPRTATDCSPHANSRSSRR